MHRAQGLYDPANEHDACGVGFVAHLRGEQSHAIVRHALVPHVNLEQPAALDRAVDDGQSFERTLYEIRRAIERAVAAGTNNGSSDCYVASFSSRTVVYKGLLRPDQLGRFYRDLSNPALASGIALVHSR